MAKRTTECCPECAARPGCWHVVGCEIENCPYCGDQLVRCGCSESPPLDDRLPWTGFFQGVEECRRLGWFGKLVPGRGWLACHPTDAGAEPDLYRLYHEARWDRWNKRFVLSEEDVAPPVGWFEEGAELQGP